MADARGEYWYFDPDVEATKITVPELRSILLKHGVSYPSSAKKAVLVGLFQDQVLPQAAQLQRQYARTKRSTRGITDMPSSTESTTNDEPDEETLLAPPVSVRRTSRRTTRASTEESEHAAPAPAPRGKTPSRTVPTKHSRVSDGEVEERPPTRRTRKSVTPAIKEPSPEPEAWHRQEVGSPFTQDNPFQSGSPALADPARDRRRRTLNLDHKEKRKSDPYRRKTYQPKSEQLDEGIVVPTRRTFDVSVPHPHDEHDEHEHDHHDEPDNYEPGEEFTGEEQLELMRERAKAGEVDILPPRRRKQPSKALETLKAFSLTLLSMTAVVIFGVWRQEKYAVGFCGVGKPSTALAGVDIPDWAEPLLPQCEPCPPHATCYQDLQVECARDFVKKEHPFWLGGLFPLPPTCEPDTEKTRRIGIVADRGVQILRKQRAAYECGETDAQGKPVESPEVGEAELKQQLTTLKRKGMSDEEFDSLFQSAGVEIERRDEIVVNANGTERRLTSNSLAELSLSCSIQRSLRQTVERYIWHLVVTLLSTVSVFYGKYRWTSSRAMEERAKYLAGEVFDRLANQAALSRQDPGRYSDPGLSMAQLRDDVLRAEFSSSKRIKLWERVQKKVEYNTNVRAAVRESPSGDISRMWEWTGPIRLIDDGRGGGSGKRDSGRYSLGPAPVGSSPPDAQEAKSWEEGHPIY